MREIKFRAWDKRNGGCMVDALDELHLHLAVGHPVMQYTGLRDKDGVEIYEGDIVKVWSGNFYMYKDQDDIRKASDEMIGTVGWSETELLYRVNRPDGKPGWWPTVTSDARGRMIYGVIGNIYQNPELLEHADV